MRDALEKVKEFHKAFDIIIGDTTRFSGRHHSVPTSLELEELRRRLMDEEVQEYRDAELADDLVSVADALCDIIYIALGTAVSYGIPLDNVFDEVHSSNMKKLWSDGPHHREDGKVLKPDGWKPPDIVGVLRRDGWDI